MIGGLQETGNDIQSRRIGNSTGIQNKQKLSSSELLGALKKVKKVKKTE
jgi:hypothetical protein